MEILHSEALLEACKLLNREVVFTMVDNKYMDFVIEYSSLFSGLMNEADYISPTQVIAH